MPLRFLDTHRQEWDLVANVIADDGRDWYLAGGTALALHLDHRDSEDLDLFLHAAFDANALADTLDATGRFVASDVAEDTVNGYVDATKVQFLGVKGQRLLEPPTRIAGLSVATPVDIMAMKINAIHGRAKLRDYVDIMLTDQAGLVSVERALAAYLARYRPRDPDRNIAQIVMALGYLDDVDIDPLSPVTLDDAAAFWTRRSQQIATHLGAHGLAGLPAVTPDDDDLTEPPRRDEGTHRVR